MRSCVYVSQVPKQQRSARRLRWLRLPYLGRVHQHRRQTDKANHATTGQGEERLVFLFKFAYIVVVAR